MSWSLVPVVDADMEELMTWLPDAAAVDLWSGPKFRYPFTRRSFRKDCRWSELASYRLQDSRSTFAAFGQISERHDRVHFARLITNPVLRGCGVGGRLLQHLIDAAGSQYDYEECGLFTYRHNAPALRCYQSAGFLIADYPKDAPMADRCYYLKRKLLRNEDPIT